MFLLRALGFWVSLVVSLSSRDGPAPDVLMRLHRIIAPAVFLLTFLTPCFAHHMAVVVNKDNHVENVTAAHLGKLFRAEVKKWPDGKAVVLVLHKKSEGETETLDRLIKMSPAELKSLIATHKDSVVLADSDADVLKIVQSTPGAVGLVEIHSVDNTINVVRVDGKLPMESGYLPH
jgi:ABC-type phosphate transport system substrate-binding protein